MAAVDGSSVSGTDSPRAWLMVFAAFVAGFTVFGVMYSFGAYLDAMIEEFDASHAASSAFFSIVSLSFYCFGSVTGHLSDRLGPRVVVGAGAIVMGTSLSLTAFIDSIWLGYLSYGIGVGFGASCVYIPTLALVGGWFVRRRGTALGIAAAGTGCGILLMPPITARLIELYGWRIADAILGVGCVLLLATCTSIVRRPPLPQAEPKRPVRNVVRTPEFMMLYLSWIFATTALFVPFVFLPAFALEQGDSHVAAAFLLSVLGGASIVGRLGIGFVVDRVGTVPVFKIAVLVMASSFLLWLNFATYWGLAVFAAALGLAYGIRISLMPGVLIEYFGIRNLGAVLGIFFTGSGISAVAGPLVAGLIVDWTDSYQWAIAFACAMGMLGFIAIVPLKSTASEAIAAGSAQPNNSA